MAKVLFDLELDKSEDGSAATGVNGFANSIPLPYQHRHIEKINFSRFVSDAPQIMLATVLAETPNFIARRMGRHFVVSLLKGHQVLSTSEWNGGFSTSVQFLVNHQSMESNADQHQSDKILSSTSEQYHTHVTQQLDIPASSAALMSTAVSMNHIAFSVKTFRELDVYAFVTAGVHGNALCAADQADWFAGQNGNESVVQAGTINIMTLINQPLLPGALTKAAAVITEAKSSVLTELAIPSKVSSNIATGTGTDQFIIAALEQDDVKPHVSASGHLKLGELLGSSVREALLEALRWQNGLERSSTQSVLQAMGRFGLTEETLFSTLKENLTTEANALLQNNRHAVLSEPRVVAASYAYAAILDRIQYGTLSTSIANDALRDQAANLAVGVSSKTSHWCDYWQKLPTSSDDVLTLFIASIAMGWETKWHD